ncbi:MAG: hypothetical protein U1E61_18455 [Bradyrhizobium sp.]
MPIPAGPGFYWAIWLTEIRGLKQTGERSDDWEVVWVFENSTDPGEKHLRVMVVGVEETLSLADFRWGPGPITPPSAAE